jgi:hypothetical protein
MSASSRNLAIVILLALLLGGVVGHALRAAPQPNQLPPAAGAKTLSAERFVLNDHQGKMMAILDLNPDGLPILALFDKTGRSRAQVSISPGADGEAFISLSDKNGKAIFYAPPK